MKLLAVVVGALSAFALQAEDDPQGSTPASLAIDAAADETTNVTEVLSGDLMLYVNTNATSTGTVKLSGANTYTGTTTVGGGTLEVTSLAPLGTASSLGVGTNVVFNGGTLHYSGATAATNGHDFTFGSGTQYVRLDGDLTATGKWMKTTGTLVKSSTGKGKLTLTGSGNKFKVVKSYAGTFELADGSTTLTSDFYLYGSVSSESAGMSRLLVTGGNHTWTTSRECLYVGYPDSTTSDYWAEFLMTGGTLNFDTRNLCIGSNQGNNKSSTVHVKMDISGGNFIVGRRFFIRYYQNDTSGYNDINLIIRDQGKVSIGSSASDNFFANCTKSGMGTATITIKDGGQLTTTCISRYSTSYTSPIVLIDGGTVCWGVTAKVFKGPCAALTLPVHIGTKGAVFACSSDSIVATYSDVALAASNTVENGTAKGVTFQTGTHVLTVTNTYAGPTEIKSKATVLAGVTNSFPSASVVTVDAGGILAVTNMLTAVGGLNLSGDLDIWTNASLIVGSSTITGSGCVTLYDDAERTILTSSPGSYKILSTAIENESILRSLAGTLRNSNAGSFEVITSSTKAFLKLTIASGAYAQPDCLVEGTNGEGTVTFSCSGTVVRKDGVKYLQPGSAATLTASSPVGGMYLAGWRDETTQDFYWGNDVAVTPTNYTTYAAVFGPAWFYDSNAKTISNGMWTFKASASGKKLTVTTLSSETTVDGVLNFATPVTNALGESYTIVKIGGTKAASSPFYNATYEQRMALTKLYIPSTLTGFGDYAFANCSNLTGRLQVPASCTLVDESAFRSCVKLTSLDLSSVTTIGSYAFNACTSITSVRLSENLSTLGSYSFSGDKNLVTVTPFLPDGLTVINREAFYNCTSLAGDLTLKNVTSVGYQPFGNNSAIQTSVYMPSVTNVGYRAFYKVAATNYVFGKACVRFMDLTTKGRGYGNQTFYHSTSTVRHFRFPGLAPDLRIVVADSGAACSNQVFGTSSQNGKVILHGSWRLDSEGWGKILDEVGSSDTTGKTLPTMLRKDREVKGWFKWYNGTTLTWGWLMDTRMFGDHGTGIGYK